MTATENTVETADQEAPAAAEQPGKKLENHSLHNVLRHLHEDQLKTWPDFKVGDLVRVHYRIIEGEKERVQVYEGHVISIRGEGFHRSFNVRRISHDVGVERIFPYHSPAIAKIEIARRGRVRRAKLFYLRHKSGKQGRIKEALRR